MTRDEIYGALQEMQKERLGVILGFAEDGDQKERKDIVLQYVALSYALILMNSEGE